MATSKPRRRPSKPRRRPIGEERYWTHLWFKDCIVCQQRFVTHKPLQKQCGQPKCAAAYNLIGIANWNRKRLGDTISKQCRQCGTPMVLKRKRGGQFQLCRPCATANLKKAKREHKHYRSRARTAGTLYAPVKVADVIAKYGRKCWICKRAIAAHDMVTMDHVVPLSLGGWHDIGNLRPAHHMCNSERGNQFTGQLMLKA